MNDVEEFAEIVLSQDISAAHHFVAKLTAQGIQMESIYLDLFAPAARLLGERWVDDVCDFTSVTLGMSRMQQILHALSLEPGPKASEMSDKSAMLVTVPGEQHGFGAVMVGEFFRRAGWNVWTGTPESEEEVLDLMMDETFNIVGFSVSCDLHLTGLEHMIERVRAASTNRDMGVLAGGRAMIANQSFAANLKADVIGIDGRQAVLKANELLG